MLDIRVHVIGDPGAGKSTVSQHLARFLAEQGFKLVHVKDTLDVTEIGVPNTNYEKSENLRQQIKETAHIQIETFCPDEYYDVDSDED